MLLKRVIKIRRYISMRENAKYSRLEYYYNCVAFAIIL